MWRQWAESLFWMRIHGCFRWEQLARAASSCVTLHQHLLLLLLRLRLRLRLFLMPNCSSLTARIGHDRFLSLAVVHLGDSGMVWITSPIDIIWICHSMRIKFNYHQLTSSSQVQFFLTGRFDCVRGHFNSDVSVRQNNNKTNQKEGGAKKKGRGGAKRGGAEHPHRNPRRIHPSFATFDFISAPLRISIEFISIRLDDIGVTGAGTCRRFRLPSVI